MTSPRAQSPASRHGSVMTALQNKFWNSIFEVKGYVPEPIRELLRRSAVLCRKAAGGRRTFTFRDREYRYFFHSYNLSWMNERAVELPIMRSEMNGFDHKAVLEIGNVLSHYSPVMHETLDKYEKAAGVINEDAVDFDPGRRYDLIICISTFEHIGQDEQSESCEKAVDAIDNSIGLLAPGGKLVASVPIGYNRAIDDLVLQNTERFTWISFMRRISGNNQWEETDRDSARRAAEEGLYLGTNALAVFCIKKSGEGGKGLGT